ncbi:MAG: FGGY family carbohydrate kinase [Bacteroidia bacterium]
MKENEPDLYQKIHKILLPGDYIAMKFTGELNTTTGGLSEGILWDFVENRPAWAVMDQFGFDHELLPEVLPTFSLQGKVTEAAARACGLRPGTEVNYRAGDQPNNALSLNVIEPGEVAATGGTSGVVYGVVDRAAYDPQMRVNSFAHVNHSAATPRIGVLLCINGAGIQYSWIKHNVAEASTSWADMERAAAALPPGSEGLRILPFGNGAERMLGNRLLGSQINNLQLNLHDKAHLYRATLEGLAFAFVYGMKIMEEMGLDLKVIRAGNDNLFQSDIFSHTISGLLGNRIELIETTGAVGAARAAGLANGLCASLREALSTGKPLKAFEPVWNKANLEEAYGLWKADLGRMISG